MKSRLCRQHFLSCLPNNGKRAHKSTVAVAMSGGIDSSAVALLLQEQGYDCVGVMMKNWDFSDEIGTEACPYSEDLKDMKSVCNRLSIPAIEVDFRKEYWNEVFTPFLDSFSTGFKTPNPDVFCNRFVKFHHLKNYVQKNLGIQTLATGHYARIHNNTNRYGAQDGNGIASQVQLLRGVDHTKDQSYFLSMTPGHLLEDVLFPLGGFTKQHVKGLVQSRFAGLHVLEKKESMGICFIGKRPIKSFLSNYIAFTPGRFLEYTTGEVLGTHDGMEGYTLGQGARISGSAVKYYIAAKYSPDDLDSRPHLRTLPYALQKGDILVVNSLDHPALYSDVYSFPVAQFNWISSELPSQLLAGEEVPLQYKARYSQSPQPCTARLQPGEQDKVMVRFQQPVRALTPGQILVLYHGDQCLGGVVI